MPKNGMAASPSANFEMKALRSGMTVGCVVTPRKIYWPNRTTSSMSNGPIAMSLGTASSIEAPMSKLRYREYYISNCDAPIHIGCGAAAKDGFKCLVGVKVDGEHEPKGKEYSEDHNIGVDA